MLEETGFDISKLINKNDYIEATIHDQIARLYIIGYIHRDTKFQPRTRNEIKACEWFPLADLPSNKKDMTPKLKMGVSPNAFFMVLPFVKRMRRWVQERNPKVFTNSSRRTRHKSMGDIEPPTSKNNKISQGLQNEITEYQQTIHQEQDSVVKPKNHMKNGNGINSNHNSSSSKTANGTNGNRKERKMAKRQLFTPQNTQSNNLSPIQKDPSPNTETQSDDMYFKFVAPSWANFKFDTRAIMECLT